MPSTLTQIADALSETAVLLEILGENQFKVRAHANASRVVETWQASVEELLERSSKGKVPGIGSALAAKIRSLFETGAEPELSELRSSLPSGLFSLLKVPGLGPKKVRALWKELGIESLEALKEACISNRVSKLKGFGAKTEEKILLGISRIESFATQFRFSDAKERADLLVSYLKEHPECLSIDTVGALRRCNEVVEGIEMLAAASDTKGLIGHFTSFPNASCRNVDGAAQATLTFDTGPSAHLEVVPYTNYAYILHARTGSPEHVLRLHERAAALDCVLAETGMTRHGAPVSITDERTLYKTLELAFVEPELREDRGEVARAAEAFKLGKTLPRLLEQQDLRGLMHAHTTYSDGRHSLREMAQAVRDNGLQYLVVTDHSRAAAYARGLSIESVRKQHREIDALNVELAPFRIFKGIESDILADGSLDYPTEILQEFEVVIASIHSGFTMSESDMTARIVSAAKNPFTTCLGHLTGRLLLERDGYAVNIPEVLRACAGEGVAVEINANPYRLDLDWRYHELALQLGIELPICPDAHSIEGLNDVSFGVAVARKGGLQPIDVPNCLPLDKFEKWCVRRRCG